MNVVRFTTFFHLFTLVFDEYQCELLTIIEKYFISGLPGRIHR